MREQKYDRRKSRLAGMACLLVAGLLWLGGCGGPAAVTETEDEAGKAAAGLAWERSLPLEYAENFSVDYYEGSYTLLTTHMDGERFLIVPEGKEVPEGLEDGISVTSESNRSYEEEV